jgi:site-specific DNA recombinase
VDRLILDPSAKGQHRRNYSQSCGPNKHWVWKPEAEWVYVPVEPIVAAELWDNCAQVLRRAQQAHPKTKPVAHLFSGFLFCHCGKKMYVPTKSPHKYLCEECRNKIPIEDLEAIYHDQLKGFLASPDRILTYLKQADQTLKEKERMVITLQQESKTVAEKADQLFRLFGQDRISAETFEARHRPLEERLSQLNDEIPRVQADADLLKVCYLSSDQIFSEARNFNHHWYDMQFDEKRRIVEQITDRIEVGLTEVNIHLAYLPTRHK